MIVLGERSSSPRPREQSVENVSDFFFLPPPSTSAMAGWQEKRGERGRKKEKETAPTQSSQSAGYMTLICNREVGCRMFALYISACIEVLNCAMLSIAEQRMQFNM